MITNVGEKVELPVGDSTRYELVWNCIFAGLITVFLLSTV